MNPDEHVQVDAVQLRRRRPTSAPAHTATSTTVAAVPCSTSRQNGVYVPAISTKIIE